MKHVHESHYVFVEPIRTAFPFLLVVGVTVVVLSLAADVDLHFNLGLRALRPIFGTSIETFVG